MKKKFINETHIEGLLYDHKLEKKVTGANSKAPGTEFIAGTISIATDDALENVVQIHYTYETATFAKSGSANSRFPVLSKIIDENPTVLNVGADKALKLRCDSAVELNEWYRDVNDEKPQSIVRNEGGFIHVVNALNEDEKQRNTFKTDMLITSVKDVEADPEKKIDAHVKVKGAIFQDYRKQLLPVEFVVRGKGGMQYFQNLDVSAKNPVFTTVWGRQLSKTVVTRTETESAFGENEVRERTNTTREFVITGCSKEPYEFDDESTITKAEISKMMADRELALADIKQRRIEYEASRGSSSAAAVPASAEDNYNF
jgi:hypothetical protein